MIPLPVGVAKAPSDCFAQCRLLLYFQLSMGILFIAFRFRLPNTLLSPPPLNHRQHQNPKLLLLFFQNFFGEVMYFYHFYFVLNWEKLTLKIYSEMNNFHAGGTKGVNDYSISQ
jgi:hypothetical protein